MKKKTITTIIPLLLICSCSPIENKDSSSSSCYESKDSSVSSISESTNSSSSESEISSYSSESSISSSSESSSSSSSSEERVVVGNIPLFYGASNVVIDKDISVSFNPYDSRWRVYAKDYEDGDLTNKIKLISNNVKEGVPGKYNVKYSITDKDKNEVYFTQNVEISNEENGKCIIDRIVYAIPAMKNMADIGLERCNKGDMQNLGIYLPKGSSATISYLDEDDHPLTTSFTNLTNTRKQNSFVNIAKNQTEATLQNVVSGTSYDCIPLITSPRLEDERSDKTYSYRLEYGKDVKPLTYYHYGDNEESFFSSWKENEHSFSLIDSEAIQFVVPFADIDKLVGVNKSFQTLDDSLTYFLNVVNRMDKMAGLSFETEDELDKNYRSKYLALADAGYTGAGAYYAGTYIAVCSSSISAMFSYGWGTLHEIGHGYQGNLGRGIGGNFTLRFGETGNNILAHYIQMDKNLYKASGNWMGGELKDIEENRNTARKAGTNIFEATGTYDYAQEKLYFIVNLLDAFGGEEVYGKLFSYYRHFLKENGTNYTIPDIYASFFYEKYNANIIPYLNGWKLDVSDSIKKKITRSNLLSYVIPSDVLSDTELSSYKANNQDALLYAPTSENVFEKEENLSLNVALNIDDLSKIEGKFIGLKHNGKFIKKIKIDSASLTLNSLYRGYFEVVFPAIDGYDMEEVNSIYLTEKDNSISQTYTKIETSFDHQSSLKLLGKVYQTVGFEMSFSNYYKLASLTFGGSNLGNQINWWKSNPDTVCASIKIKDSNDELLSDWTVKGQGYFSSLENRQSSIELEYGYKIEVYYYFGGQYINVYSKNSSNNKAIEAYSSKDNTKTFEVTEYGLKLLNEDNFDTKEVMYEVIKDDWIKEIRDIQESLNEESLSNRNEDIKIKNKIVTLYNRLEDKDKPQDIEELLNKIKRGGSPIITLKNVSLTINKGDNIDLYSLISIYDNEDFVIESNKDNVLISGEYDVAKERTYSIKYSVTDMDGNTSTVNLTLIVK